jgi:hypothetical protein
VAVAVVVMVAAVMVEGCMVVRVAVAMEALAAVDWVAD